jgi:hypothetical protein
MAMNPKRNTSSNTKQANQAKKKKINKEEEKEK